MGRKVHPIGFRLGIIRRWDSRWYAEKREFGRRVIEDMRIRRLIRGTLGRAGISRINIERFPKRIAIGVKTAKPGIVIGRRGASINALKSRIEELTGVSGSNLRVDVVEIEHSELDAHVVAEGVAEQLERRISYRRAMRQTVFRTMRAGAQGVRIQCKGRLSGAEMGRTDWVREGRVPLHTLRADIDYATAEAATTFGRVGVKVWIYRGEILPEAAREAVLAG